MSLIRNVRHRVSGKQLSVKNNYVHTIFKGDFIHRNIKTLIKPMSPLHRVMLKNTSGVFSQSNNCEYCKGTMYIRCYTCHGNGKVYKEGMREYICDDCHRSGTLICDMCGGSGINFIG
jgi:hypothetical protein